MGLLTAERVVGDRAYALFDRLPAGTVMALTMVSVPQDRLENHLNLIQSRAVGEGIEARLARKDVETAKDYLAGPHKLYRLQLAFYVRGRDLAELDRHTNRAGEHAPDAMILSRSRANDDPIGLDHYLLNLPMVYDPTLDPRAARSTRVHPAHRESRAALRSIARHGASRVHVLHAGR